MLPTLSRLALAVLGLALAFPAPADAASGDRRGRTTPGLVLETGARHASCDILEFTPDGNKLLAAGDDKVVRVWPVGKTTLDYRDGRILRWPIYREQRGGIFSLAQSPADGGKRLAIGGFGIITGMLFVLDRDDGEIKQYLDQPSSTQVVWSIAWSPDARYIVYGTSTGEIFRWDVGGRARAPVLFAGTGGRTTNRVRSIAFVDASRFVYVTEDGRVHLRDVRQTRSGAAKPVGGFGRGELMDVAFSADKRWLAAASQNASGEAGARIQQVELIDLKKLLAEGASASGVRQVIPMPERPGFARFPMAVTFDARGEKLAVGMQEVRHLPPGVEPFARVTGGLVHVWALHGGRPAQLTTSGLEVGYRPDKMGFRPGAGDNAWQLAVAGGPNNEVRLWDVRKEGAPLSTVRSPGSNIWSVALSANDKYLGWKEQLNTNPASPNDRGTGEWRVFTLEGKVRSILPNAPKDFVPVQPIATYGGWKVQPVSGFLWRILGPGGTSVDLSDRTGLYLQRVNQIPRCWTFLPPPAGSGKPPRLAIGHQWGVSIYELRPGDVRLARMLVGHESEVMAVAPSANGKLLVTAGRDQTIACWSLEDWPSQAELGASFTARGGKLIVRKVDPGSPAWEANLTDGDEVVMVVSRDPDGKGGFVYDPEKQGLAKHGFVLPNRREVTLEQVAKLLANAQPAREYIFAWRHDGKEEKQLTTVRQRPLWRFFPTRKEAGSNWVLWRWRDYYYDTNSAEPDRLLGWQVNPEDLGDKPVFYPLSRFSGGGDRGPKGERKGFHNPDKVWKFIKDTNQEPEKVIFAQIEPPEVRLRVVTPADAKKKQPLVLQATVRPRNPGEKQKLRRVMLWLDDYLYRPLIPDAAGVVDQRVTVPMESLRRGRNEITLSAFNNEGGRGQDMRVQFFVDPSRGKPMLHALCVGVNVYSRTKNFEGSIADLHFSEPDARSLCEVFKQHKNSEVYRDAEAELLRGPQATRANILAELRKIKQRASSDDWVVLFLSGHGQGTTTPESYEPYSFAYLCPDADQKRPDTLLKAKDLIDALGAIPCRKLILMDACHSGEVVDDPVRALNQDGPHFLIFAACKGNESALEPNPKLTAKYPKLRELKHGLFTEGLLDALGPPERLAAGAKRSHPVTGTEVADRVKLKVDELLLMLKAPGEQTPVFEPRRNDERLRLELFCRP
jgi:WD40 repeat protein